MRGHHDTLTFISCHKGANAARYQPSCPPLKIPSNFSSFSIENGRQPKPRSSSSETGPLPTKKSTPTTLINSPR
ncbi:Ribosome biogenesis protein nsa2 [Fusarium oxysporum f. sp. albedinis]|nr:Ribosome biogenesis protein nsa2 [Fusarium oxysporum f. sp. albedinis]